jgi:small subunit ribosomal protein S8
MVTDPISDMLIQIKNASKVGKESVTLPFSNIKMEIAQLLIKEGYLTGAVKKGKKNKKYLSCDIAYVGGSPKIDQVKRISKPSRRIYRKSKEIKSVRQGEGLLVMTTPKGLLTGQEAREQGVGGEVLFMLW